MEEENKVSHVSRIIHLVGGMHAINISDLEVKISPNTLHGKVTQFHAHSYGSIYSDLQGLGFSVAGVDFYSHASEIKGEVPPNWRVFNQCADTAWPSEEVARVWKGIAHVAFQQKDGHIWDLCSRISHQLRVCSWRIRELSEAYHQQLMAKSKKNEARPGLRYEDGFTWNTYLAVQSYLVDACILRDYLSEFAAVFIFGRRYGIDCERISTLGGLVKKVLSRIDEDDPLAEDFKNATGDGGWLKVLGGYRDLVVHSSPLAHAEMKLYAVIDILQINIEGAIPLNRIPLPIDPGGISASRASRGHFSDFERQFDLFTKAVSEGASTIDAMTYILEVHGELASLAIKLSDESPIAYQDIVLTEEDIVGSVKVISE